MKEYNLKQSIGMGISTAALLFIITGCVAALAGGIAILYAYLYYTQIKPKAERMEREYYRSHPSTKEIVHRGVTLSREPFKKDLEKEGATESDHNDEEDNT